jgi:hypothetical protein
MKIPTLKEVFIICEDSRGNIVKLLKLPKEVADLFHEADPKNSFLLAKLFKEYFVDKDTNAIDLLSYANDLLKGKLGTISKLLKKSQKYVSAITKLSNEKDSLKNIYKFVEDDNTFSELRKKAFVSFSDGFFWSKIPTKIKKREAKRMGHCGTDFKGDMFYLYDKENNPHVTLTYNEISNTVF